VIGYMDTRNRRRQYVSDRLHGYKGGKDSISVIGYMDTREARIVFP
jgi:hypothetical protein